MNHPPAPNEYIQVDHSPERAIAFMDMDQLWLPLRQAIHDKIIPGAVAAVSYRGQQIQYAAGWAVDTPNLRVPTRIDTIYDCASLTKVAVTLPLILILVNGGIIGLDDNVSRYVPELIQPAHSDITIRQLLAHTSGFPATIDSYIHGWTINETMGQISQLQLQYTPGTGRIYSDIGFILLGWLFEKVSGISLEQGAQRWLWQPLGMKDSRFNPPETLIPRIAATEYDESLADWLRGTVHDENARQFGGMAGHAGWFATAQDVLTYGQSWLAAIHRESAGKLESAKFPFEQARPFSSASLQTEDLLTERSPIHVASSAIRRQTPELPGIHRGLGWVLHSDEQDVAGQLLSPATFGHTGFTGTSLYVDPEQQLVIVLLTNRVHYGRQQSIQQLRRDFHNAVAEHIATKGTLY